MLGDGTGCTLDEGGFGSPKGKGLNAMVDVKTMAYGRGCWWDSDQIGFILTYIHIHPTTSILPGDSGVITAKWEIAAVVAASDSGEVFGRERSCVRALIKSFATLFSTLSSKWCTFLK